MYFLCLDCISVFLPPMSNLIKKKSKFNIRFRNIKGIGVKTSTVQISRKRRR